MTPEEFKKIRQQAELSQQELAEKIGVKQPRVSDWEKGKRVIPAYIEKLMRLVEGGKI
jgi:DNA-binding transcriptional regulator YiaG